MTKTENFKFKNLSYEEQEFYLDLKSKGSLIPLEDAVRLYHYNKTSSKSWLKKEPVNEFVLLTNNQKVKDAYNKMINPFNNG